MSRDLRHFRGAPCLRKKSFATESRAQERLDTYARLHAGMSAQRAYECPWCKQWHLTAKSEDDR